MNLRHNIFLAACLQLSMVAVQAQERSATTFTVGPGQSIEFPINN
jgi:hypothetical protein